MEKEYIVGVDFGHGETAAYVIPIREVGIMENDGVELKIRNGNTPDQKVCPSVVYCTQNNEFSLSDGEGKKLIAAFKGRISQLDSEKKVAYKGFIRCVFESIARNNNYLKVDNTNCNFYFCIACPTRWNKSEREEYITFFNEILAPYNSSVLFLMNESDAAYFTNINSIDSHETALVIDYGSSTIDYTLMQNHLKISDDKWSNQQLGASLIEKTLLLKYKDNQFDDYNTARSQTVSGLIASGNEFIIDNIDLRLEYEIRTAKESSYTKEDSTIFLQYTFYKITNYSDLKKVRFHIEFDDFNDDIIDYREEVRRDFVKLADNIKKKTSAPLNKIVLSGGASIMPWVEDYVKEIFPGASIVKDLHPSYVVAKGVAKYAKAQLDALNRIISILEQVDYADIYKKADSLAMSEAAKQMFPEILNKITENQDISANEIFLLVANFFYQLNSGNAVFCEMFKKNVNSTIRNRISEEIKNTILKTFNIDIDVSDIDFQMDVQVMNFRPEFFEEGDGGKKIYQILESATGPHLFTPFDHKKKRSKYERDNIAKELERGLTVVDPFGPVLYDSDDLNRIIDIVKHYTLTYAKNLFHEKELFATTFIQQ